MEYTLFVHLQKVLAQDDRLVADGELLRNRIVELARKSDALLLKHLLGDAKVKKEFFAEVEGVQVFDSERFVRFVNNKQFLPDSYTAFKNKIGLADGDEYIAEKHDVVLNWPYKDCVLEGGQTKEDAKRDEVFWNETLAPDQIHRLLEPKVLTNWKRYTKDGATDVGAIRRDAEINKKRGLPEDTITDNLIIKGNNLLALHSLKQQFAGKVKLIYIDPPYNTGNDDFGYNDKFNHTAWLTFMRNRLEVARDLLTPNGSIYVQLDYNEVHYAKILMDEVFGRENFQREIIWDISVLSGYKTIADNWVRGHDSILFYSKDHKQLAFNKVRTAHDEKYLARFNKKDPETGRMYFDGRGEKIYLDEVIKKGKALGDVWDDIISFQQAATAKERIKDFSGQKPENLLGRIIMSATNEGDIVLDYHIGTGTTVVAAHKMKRQYIGVEQMDYVEAIAMKRLNDVIAGDQGGISNSTHWKGGGDFVYAELMPLNQVYKEKVEMAKDAKGLAKVWAEIQEKGFLSYKLDLKKFAADAKDFSALSLADQKRFILESLDYNQLYVNYAEMGDATYAISPADKKLNKEFFQGI